jgi:predicted lipase
MAITVESASPLLLQLGLESELALISEKMEFVLQLAERLLEQNENMKRAIDKYGHSPNCHRLINRDYGKQVECSCEVAQFVNRKKR